MILRCTFVRFWHCMASWKPFKAVARSSGHTRWTNGRLITISMKATNRFQSVSEHFWFHVASSKITTSVEAAVSYTKMILELIASYLSWTWNIHVLSSRFCSNGLNNLSSASSGVNHLLCAVSIPCFLIPNTQNVQHDCEQSSWVQDAPLRMSGRALGEHAAPGYTLWNGNVWLLRKRMTALWPEPNISWKSHDNTAIRGGKKPRPFLPTSTWSCWCCWCVLCV